jgi:hypothetical protein
MAVGAREGGGVNSLKTLSNLVRHMSEIQFMNTRKTKPQFNWEIDLGTEMILVAVLQSEDGGVNHGVTIFGGYIFDSYSSNSRGESASDFKVIFAWTAQNTVTFATVVVILTRKQQGGREVNDHADNSTTQTSCV